MLDSALGLFVTQGYDATSMDDIASRAGLTKGAVYFYFKDKVSLLHALLERTESDLFDPIFDELRASGASATDRIIRLTNWFARVGADRPELPLLHVLVSLQMLNRDNIAEDKVRQTYDRLHAEITTIIEDGQQSGEFSTEVAANEQAAVFAALIDGLLLEWHRWGDRVSGRALATSARNLILHGLSRATP
ncbi:MAG: TetR family transcriptional regulator [Woeseiaceae bacterium]|nr:TetR family transcriptional regulator [Woeseiaceae bacterium]